MPIQYLCPCSVCVPAIFLNFFFRFVSQKLGLNQASCPSIFPSKLIYAPQHMAGWPVELFQQPHRSLLIIPFCFFLFFQRASHRRNKTAMVAPMTHCTLQTFRQAGLQETEFSPLTLQVGFGETNFVKQEKYCRRLEEKKRHNKAEKTKVRC